ncbi:MarR family transcriptional regulator [Ruminococcus albus]|uniref:Transcriptional regulator, MarR family n=1 Tax=Ruminococcus albus (strain ATCC 27210 / DSM 20455 / JCM 14654 / NCDO 2250 / 7) TaxID=697329 RepID=E6UIE1_RUMA7|nr:MarR family transcriptional regulator [Ruminococcus albus]ADU22202.1 transcriptional regulator, MarR family [Ruminococcus albus 7 = DSM 20455]
MDNEIRTGCIMQFYEIYPLSRKLVFDTFDQKKYHVTRTQQIVLLSLSVCGQMNMSQLASKINTSNEQATRAVAQLVDMGFIERNHQPDNRRVVNISLTEKAESFLIKMKADIREDLLDLFSNVSDEDMKKLYNALIQVNEVLRQVMDI